MQPLTKALAGGRSFVPLRQMNLWGGQGGGTFQLTGVDRNATFPSVPSHMTTSSNFCPPSIPVWPEPIPGWTLINKTLGMQGGGAAPDQSASRPVPSISTDQRHLTPVSLGSGDAAKELAS